MLDSIIWEKEQRLSFIAEFIDFLARIIADKSR